MHLIEHLRNSLHIVAEKRRTTGEVETKGIVEIFRMNGQEARLMMMLQGRGVGTPVHSIIPQIESYEYLYLDWWKEIIDEQGRDQFEFLDPLVGLVAKDAGLQDWKSYFSPQDIVEKYGLYKGYDATERALAEAGVANVICNELHDTLGPDYSLSYRIDLRLDAVSEAARASRYEITDLYRQTGQKILAATPSLVSVYQDMARSHGAR